MSRLGTILRVIFGLFVDDGHFAAAILAWVLLVWQMLPGLGAWNGVILFVGLALILVESATRRARR